MKAITTPVTITTVELTLEEARDLEVILRRDIVIPNALRRDFPDAAEAFARLAKKQSDLHDIIATA